MPTKLDFQPQLKNNLGNFFSLVVVIVSRHLRIFLTIVMLINQKQKNISKRSIRKLDSSQKNETQKCSLYASNNVLRLFTQMCPINKEYKFHSFKNNNHDEKSLLWLVKYMRHVDVNEKSFLHNYQMFLGPILSSTYPKWTKKKQLKPTKTEKCFMPKIWIIQNSLASLAFILKH